jgi:hypothetical protein
MRLIKCTYISRAQTFYHEPAYVPELMDYLSDDSDDFLPGSPADFANSMAPKNIRVPMTEAFE